MSSLVDEKRVGSSLGEQAYVSGMLAPARPEISGSVYEITTQENAILHVELAGLGSRAGALLIDLCVMAVVVQSSSYLLTPLQWVASSAKSSLVMVLSFAIQWWYAALCEYYFSGRTCGKWAMRIATQDRLGRRLSLAQCAVRNLLRIVDLLPGLYLVGGLSAWLDPHYRRLGDLAAGTIVVSAGRTSRLDALTRSAAARALHTGPPMLSAAERSAIYALSARREGLPIAQRVELFQRLAEHLRQRLGLQQLPVSLSAEQVVLDVCAQLDLEAVAPS